MKTYAIISLVCAAVILAGLIILAIIAVRVYRQMKAQIAELEEAVAGYEKMIYGAKGDNKKNRR